MCGYVCMYVCKYPFMHTCSMYVYMFAQSDGPDQWQWPFTVLCAFCIALLHGIHMYMSMYLCTYPFMHLQNIYLTKGNHVLHTFLILPSLFVYILNLDLRPCIYYPYVYVCMHACVRTYFYIYTCIVQYICIYMYLVCIQRTYVCMCVCIYVCTVTGHVLVPSNIHICLISMSICMESICICIYRSISVHKTSYTCVCMYTHVYIDVCIHVPTYVCILHMYCKVCMCLWYVGMYVCIYVCMYVCMSVCMHLCMYICMHVCRVTGVIYTSTYVCMCVCMYVCIHIFMCVYTLYTCMHVCTYMYACIYVCMYVCMYICNTLYIYIVCMFLSSGTYMPYSKQLGF